MRPAAIMLILILASIAGCLGESPPEKALNYLETGLPNQDLSGRIHILNAVVAVGHDPRNWPDANTSIMAGLETPSLNGDRMRMLYALGTADDLHDWDILINVTWLIFDGEQFGSNFSLVDDALAVAALIAAGENPGDSRIVNVTQYLKQSQAEDGGWRFDGGLPGEVDETAFVLRALSMAGTLDDVTRSEAERFLSERTNFRGGYGYGGVENCHSSGLALLAWSFVAETPPSNSVRYVERCQNEDGGFPLIKGGPSQVWATAEIVQGLAVAR